MSVRYVTTNKNIVPDSIACFSREISFRNILIFYNINTFIIGVILSFMLLYVTRRLGTLIH